MRITKAEHEKLRAASRPATNPDLDLLRARLAAIDRESEQLRHATNVANKRLVELANLRSNLWKAIAEHTMVKPG